MRKVSLGLLFLIVFMDMVGFGFIIPLIPDYIAQFGGAYAFSGVLMAVYALGQFVAAPIVGRLSDRFGRKPLLLFSIGGTFLSLLTLALAPNLVVVFLARLLDGLTGGNITVAQSYIVDVTDERSRARGLGIIGMAFGLGFILGPSFGGYLSGFGLAVPAFAAAGIAFVNLWLIALLLPESLTAEGRETLRRNPRRAFSPALLRATLRREGTGAVLLLTLVFSFAFILFESMFAAFTAESLRVESSTRGYLLAYVGVLVALVQGGLVGILARRFDERYLAAAALGVAAISMLAYALVPSVELLIAVIAPLSLGSGVASTLLRTLLSESVPREQVGGTLGLAASAESLTRVLAPVVGSALFAALGPRAPNLAAAALLGLALILAWWKLVREDCLAKDGPACRE